jgi:hypothetical protein
VSAVIGRRAEAPPDEPEVPEIPEWLVDELHGNVAFVRDAIEANPTGIAVVYARPGHPWSSSQTYRAIQDAVEAYIEREWHRENYDAEAISRAWKKEAANVA